MKVKIYETGPEIKSLTEKIMGSERESKAIAIDARVLTSLIDKAFLGEEYLDTRSLMTTDKSEISVASRTDEEHLRIAFYKENNRTPIVFEYSGPEVKRLYDLLK